jgi:hypothetical protein
VALADLLKSAFDFEPKDTSDQQLLAQIPHFKHIITTNYDSLLEDAYGESCNLVVTNSDLSQVDSRKPTIYKVHGDFSHPDDIVIAQRDYKRMYSQKQENLLWDTIRAEFSRHNVLFIGYSISDQNIQMLIEYVKEQMGESAKQLFVLTPDAEETALLQLKELGVEYIQGKAEDLFNELIPELRSHIVEDFEQHTTSSEDCNQFMRVYDLIPSFELGDSSSSNRLLALRSVSGNSIQHTIHFSLKGGDGLSKPLDQIPAYNDERFGNLPIKRIADFQGFEYRANDIRISHSQSAGFISLVPMQKNGELSFDIPKKNIFAKNTCRYFNNWNQYLQVEVDIDIGIFEIQIPISPNTECGFRFRQNDKYISNSTAIVWERIFYALFCGDQFTMTLISEEKLTRTFTYSFKKNKLKEERKDAKRALQYYKYIQDIESIRGCNFKEYEKFTDDNLFVAEILYHYLNKEPIIVRHPSKGFEYAVPVSEIVSQSNLKHKTQIMESVDNVCGSLNGVKFKIPYMQRIYKQSILKSIKKDDRGFYVLRFVDKAKEHTILLTDVPLYNETERG